MTFLTKIGNFIKTEIIGVEEKKETPKNNNANTDILHFETKNKENIDTLDLKTDKNLKEIKKPTNKMSYSAMTQTLENIPTKHFNIRKMIREGAFEKVSGILKSEFEKLSPEEQKQVITAYRYSVLKFDKLKEEGKINPEAKPEELISYFGKILYESLKCGDFQNTKDFEDNAGNIINDLGDDFDNKSIKDKRIILKNERLKENANLQKKLAEIDKLPENKREKLRARILRRHRARVLARHIDIAAQKDSKTAIHSIVLLNSKDITLGTKTVLESRATDEIRTETADYIDFNNTKELISDFKEFKDEIGEKDLTSYTSTFMRYKSEEGVEQYQAEYIENRNKYESAVAKKNRGETLTAEEQELLSTMSSKDYTASAIGIGEGTLENINMSNESKAEFYTKWTEDAKQFNDYKEVTSTLENKITQNTEYRDLVKTIKRKQTSTSKEKNNSNDPTNTTIQNEAKNYRVENDNIRNYRLKELYPKEDTELQYNTSPIASKVPVNFIKNAKNTVSTKEKFIEEKDIANEIKNTGNIQKVITKYGHKAIKIILDDTNLKHLRTQLKPIIKGYNIEDLLEITNNCSDNSFIYICHMIKKDYIQELKANREHSKSLSYSAKNIVEKIERANCNV